MLQHKGIVVFELIALALTYTYCIFAPIQYEYGDSESADATIDGYGGVMRDSETFFSKEVCDSVTFILYSTASAVVVCFTRQLTNSTEPAAYLVSSTCNIQICQSSHSVA
jgi:hypothetical protein